MARIPRRAIGLVACCHYALYVGHSQRVFVAMLHTASLPTASCTGTRSTGLDPPLSRDQPITATLTGSSTVYQICRQLLQRRCRVTFSGRLLLVCSVRISKQPHRGQFTGSLA